MRARLRIDMDAWVNQPARISGVLFDLDGTLLDSAPDLVASLNWLRSSEGLPELDVVDMAQFASRGAVGLLNAAFPPGDSEQFERRRLAFLEHYAQHSYRDSSLYEGTVELIDYLDQSAIPWGIVTNKMESLTLPILKASGLARTVSAVVCGDTLKFSKPHPAPVLLACEIMGVEPHRVLFVGDDVRDIEVGEAAGTMTAAALYGYGANEFTEAHKRNSLALQQPSTLRDLLASA